MTWKDAANDAPTRPTRISAFTTAILVLCLVAAVSPLTARGQSSTTTARTPGTPAGSYKLGDADTINLFTGNLNYHLPLLAVGGRGEARAGLGVVIEGQWDMQETALENPEGFLQHEYSLRSPNPLALVGYVALDIPVTATNEPCTDSNERLFTSRVSMTYVEPDGTQHALRDRVSHGLPIYSCGGGNTNVGNVFESTSGNFVTFVTDTDIHTNCHQVSGCTNGVDGWLYFRDGTRARVGAGKIQWSRDRNGNKIEYTYDQTLKLIEIKDSIGRKVNIYYDVNEGGLYGLCHKITYRGFGGTEKTIRISKEADLTRVLRTTRPYDSPTPVDVEYDDPNDTIRLTATNADHPGYYVKAVWLPGDRKYEFKYNVLGQLARVELPTGGAIEYDFADVFHIPFDPVPGPLGPATNRVSEKRVYNVNDVLVSRTVFTNPTAYTAGVIPPSRGGTVRDVEVFGAAGNSLSKSRHYFYGAPNADYGLLAPWWIGREFRTEAFDAGGAAPLRVAENSWRQRVPAWCANTWPCQSNPSETAPTNNPFVVETTSTLADGNLVSKVSGLRPTYGIDDPNGWAFDPYNNQTDVWRYDYGAGQPGALLGHTQVSYINHVMQPGGVYLFTRADTASEYNVDAEGDETLAASTQTLYDEYSQYPLMPYDAVTGWEDPGSARGNLTTVRRWLDTSGTWVETHARYDQLGNVREAWDARGKLTQTSYADSFCNDGGVRCGGTHKPNTYAFPTETTSPVPGFGSASALTTSTVYDYYTGFIYSVTDPNNRTTGFEYEDQPGQLDRLKAELRPNGGRTEFNYGDTVGNLFVQMLTLLEGTRKVESKQYFDGLGRPYRTATYENSSASAPWLNADTEYDALGRAWRVSTPYRSAGGGVPLTSEAWSNANKTETAYDALGRVRTVTTRPDNAVVSTDYSGDRVLVTDQAGRRRISKADALGRLTEVWEVTPNDPARYPGVESIPSAVTAGLTASAYGYRTEYFYDAMGNLRRVKQGGQQRFFASDSLGRLVRARNPEQGSFTPDAAGGDFLALTDETSGVSNNQWSIGYLYDANGNLTKRRDARGTTTAYGYDALNRNVTVTYTPGGQTAETPDVRRHYDNTAVGANGKGRLWKSEAVHAALTTVDKYDEAGRPKEQTQKFWAGGDWGPQAYTTRLTYNLAGGVTSQEYPSGNRVFYQYDSMGRLGDNGQLPAFKGTLGDGVERTYDSQITYSHLGGIEQERFGTATPLYHKRHYNRRGQLYDIRLSTVAWAADQWNWNRGALVNYYGGNYAWEGDPATPASADNNGNLRRQQVRVPDDEQNSTHTFTQQTYDYDALNRLSWVVEAAGANGTAGADSFKQAYDYDRWGNRTINAAGTQVYDQNATYAIPEPQFSVDAATNRLGVPAGQAGAMTYDPAGNLTFDSYQGGKGGGGARTYDAENRMTSAQYLSGQTLTANYAYDADGRRVKRNVGLETEVWQVYGGSGELLAEYAPGALHSAPQKEYGYRGGELLVTASPGAGQPPQQPRVNVARSSNGGVATASSSLNSPPWVFTPAGANDGDRKGANWGSGGGWNDAAPPVEGDWLEVAFGGAKSIDEVDVFTNQDNYPNPSEPTETMTFTQYGLTAFEVQYWDGSAWQTVPSGSVTGNNQVWRKFTFPAVTTTRIRLLAHASPDGYSRLAEVEAWGTDAPSGTAAAPYDAVTDFSAAQNPAGAWSYGYRSGGGQFTPSAVHNQQFGGGLDSWSPGTCCPSVTRNSTGQTQTYAGVVTQPADLLNLHPGPSGERSVVRWTAPAAGTYAVAGRFQGIDTAGTTTDVLVTKNGAEEFSSSVTGYGAQAPFSLSLTLAAGDVVEFSGGYGANGTYDDDSTGLAVSITAGGGAPSGADVRWLVSDHLGTPRMVVDKTGSLAGVSRHDYLPFGEELSAAMGGRGAIPGYAADHIRQKWGTYERDDEIELDYAVNRYYAMAQGRFTSVDPLNASAKDIDPQTWNRYATAAIIRSTELT